MHFTNKQLYNIILTMHSLILAVQACTKFACKCTEMGINMKEYKLRTQ